MPSAPDGYSTSPSGAPACPTCAEILDRLDAIERRQIAQVEALSFIVMTVQKCSDAITQLGPVVESFARSPLGKVIAGRLKG